MSHVMAIDAGTGSVRAIIFTDEGKPVGSSSRAWEHLAEPEVPGSMGFDWESNWGLIVAAIRDALREARLDGADIAAVSATSMREAFVLLDADGHEIWACANVDARAEGEVRALAREPGIEEHMYARSGQTFALSAQPRLLWLKNHRPELYDRASSLLMVSEWVLYRLSGVAVMEPSNGSTSGLVNLESRDVDPELLTACGLREISGSRMEEPGTVIGAVTHNASLASGLSTSTHVVVGGGDAQMAALGLGMVEPGQAVIVAGTFWQQLVNLPTPRVDPDMRVRINAAAISHMWQAEAIAFHAGTSVRWFRDTFAADEVRAAATTGENPLDRLVEAASHVPIGSDGVIPIFSDVMNYRQWKHAAPSFLNLSLDGGPRARAAMFRSLLENAAIVAAANMELVESFSGTRAERVLFAGGSAQSEVWTQIVADVLGRPVLVPAVSEATAQGAAACAAAGAGQFTSPAEAAASWVRWDRETQPDPARHAEYEGVKHRWHHAYAAQLDLMNAGVTTAMWRAPGS